MKKYSILILFILSTLFLQAAKVVPLPDLKRPFFIKVDDSQVYISDGPTVSVYFLKDLSLIKKFGRQGEGPREFKTSRRNAGAVMISLTDELIVVNSVNKISLYT
ncbi:MAG: hypothetical protein GY757_38340, partial [bacterium]|nr:hypothetical protein [bacterium]